MIQELFLTMIFTAAVLIVKYSSLIKGADRIFKGIALTYAMGFCYGISASSGACLNPAIGLTVTIL